MSVEVGRSASMAPSGGSAKSRPGRRGRLRPGLAFGNVLVSRPLLRQLRDAALRPGDGVGILEASPAAGVAGGNCLPAYRRLGPIDLFPVDRRGAAHLLFRMAPRPGDGGAEGGSA